jgi:hypothetical protein
MARHKKARKGLTPKQKGALKAGIMVAPMSAGLMMATAGGATAGSPPAAGAYTGQIGNILAKQSLPMQ